MAAIAAQAGRPRRLCRRRRARHGGAGPRKPRPDRRPRDQWICRDPGPAAGDPAASPHDHPRRHRRAPRCAGHHRQSRFHPSGGAAGARGGAVDPDHRLCVADRMGVAPGPGRLHATLCRPRAGAAAVRAGRASPARRPAMHLCRPSPRRAGRDAAARSDWRPRGAMPTRPWSSCCRGAAAARSGGTSRVFGAAMAAVQERIGAVEIVLPTVPHLVDEVKQATPRLAGGAADRRRARRRNGRRSARRGRRSPPRGRSRSSSRSPASRPSSPIGSHCSRRLIARALVNTDTIGLANLILGEKVDAGVAAAGCDAGKSRRRTWFRSSAIRRSAGDNARRWRGSMPSWKSASPCRARVRPPSCSPWPADPARFHRRMRAC